jgi:hypothetical protein
MALTTNRNILAILFIGFITFTNAHIWIEQLTVIALNSTFVGAPGYARGNVLRTSPNFNDATITNLILPDGRFTGSEILSIDLMCMPS